MSTTKPGEHDYVFLADGTERIRTRCLCGLWISPVVADKRTARQAHRIHAAQAMELAS